jgi:hypothetical protein
VRERDATSLRARSDAVAAASAAEIARLARQLAQACAAAEALEAQVNGGLRGLPACVTY